MTPDDLPDRILAALRRRVVPTSADELAEDLGERPATLRRALGNLVRKGAARRAGGGRYTTSRRYL